MAMSLLLVVGLVAVVGVIIAVLALGGSSKK